MRLRNIRGGAEDARRERGARRPRHAGRANACAGRQHKPLTPQPEGLRRGKMGGMCGRRLGLWRRPTGCGLHGWLAAGWPRRPAGHAQGHAALGQPQRARGRRHARRHHGVGRVALCFYSVNRHDSSPLTCQRRQGGGRAAGAVTAGHSGLRATSYTLYRRSRGQTDSERHTHTHTHTHQRNAVTNTARHTLHFCEFVWHSASLRHMLSAKELPALRTNDSQNHLPRRAASLHLSQRASRRWQAPVRSCQ